MIFYHVLQEKKYVPVGAEKDLVEGLERDIVQKNPNVRWYIVLIRISFAKKMCFPYQGGCGRLHRCEEALARSSCFTARYA